MLPLFYRCLGEKFVKSNVIAIIPAREYDANLHNKNTLPFGRNNLLQHKIEQLKKVRLIDKVVVSTDSRSIAKLALESGVEVDDRPSEYSSHNSSFNTFINYIGLKYCEDELILWAPVITPFIDEKDYQSAIQIYRSMDKNIYDSLITVVKTKRHLLDQNGPLNFRFKVKNRSSQNLPDLFQYVNGISIARACDLVSWQYNWGEMPYMLEVSGKKAMDICDEVDYLSAKFLYEKSVL